MADDGAAGGVAGAENDVLDMERRARIMDLAQQQQMALQRLDEVVQNQINLRQNILADAAPGNDDERAARREEEEGEEERGGEDREDERRPGEERRRQRQPRRPQSPPAPNDRARRQLLPRQPRGREGGRGDGDSRSITRLYFALSALLAFLAVVTSPSDVLFDPARVASAKGAEEASQLQHAVDAIRSQMRGPEDGGVVAAASAVAVDASGNSVDGGGGKGGEWEAVAAAQAKARHSSFSEPPSKRKRAESQLLPPSSSSSWHLVPFSWTEMWNNFAVEVREHFNEQYFILRQVGSHLMPEARPPPRDAADVDAGHSGGSARSWWSFRLEWLNRKRDPDDDGPKSKRTIDENDGRRADREAREGRRGPKNYRRLIDVSDVELHSLFSPVLRVIDPTLPFLPGNDGGTAASSGGERPTPSPTGSAGPGPEGLGGAFRRAAERVLASTPRLIAMANLLLAATYLLQSAVADAFLGPVNASAARAGSGPNDGPRAGPPNVAGSDDLAARRRRTGRERFGGFLLFKLLLVSAVLEPDGVDMFILLLWYTLLSFLRSLAHLAGTTANHASQSGEPPSPGALRLLLLVLACDAVAAMACSALCLPAGLLNLLLLLTCDCAMLGVDATAHVVRHGVAMLEEGHRLEVSLLEERQAELHARRRRGRRRVGSDDAVAGAGDDNLVYDENDEEGSGARSDAEEWGTNFGRDDDEDDHSLEEELRQIDRLVEEGEADHVRCMATFDWVVFMLEILNLIITIGHFLHIWALHGTSFGLVDGVLALHLHSTVSMIGKKIAERRNAHRISRELNDNFPDASDIDVRKASASGDVCCICLNSMMVGPVKKVGCGHMFHAHCLREVVERERSIAAAKCPLCRASLITGRQDPFAVRPVNGGGLGNNGAGGNGGGVGQAQPAPRANLPEQSLLRFSTEGILPAWLPIPAFAFEVVRRETTAAVEPNPNPERGWLRFLRRGGEVQTAVGANGNNNANGQQQNDEPPAAAQPQEQQQQPQREPSFWRRLLILVGAIPMSPEEEASALEQLVDMFPQYDRADLLRELRSRRSAEAVAESILLGIFSGIPRGGVGADAE